MSFEPRFELNETPQSETGAKRLGIYQRKISICARTERPELDDIVKDKYGDVPHNEEDNATLFSIEESLSLPDGGYGWVCVACVFCINAHTWGINSAYGIFLAHYLSTSTFPNTTPITYAFIGGLSISQAMVVSPLTTSITRRYSTKTTLSIGILLQTSALIGASFATQVWHLFLSQGMLFGWGMGFLFVGSAGIIPQWFSSKRSLANGIAAAGAGMGGLVYNLATSTMIARIGLQRALQVLAVCSGVMHTICTVLIKDRNKVVQPNQAAFNFALLRRPNFLLVVAWGFLSELGYVVLLFSLPDYAVSIGLSASQGSIVAALLNLGLCIGRPLVGYVSDISGRLNMAALMTALCGALCLGVWVFANSFSVLCTFSVFAGMFCGTFWSTVGPVGAEIVGLKELPAALNLVFLFMALPTTFAEPIALILRQETGDVYLITRIFTGVMFVGAAICAWLMRSWKIAATERDAIEKRKRDEAQYSRNRDGLKLDEFFALLARSLVTWRNA